VEFKRKKKRGINQKTCRLWFSAEGYRITWRKEVFGVAVPPVFQACVRTIVPGCFEGDSSEMWDFVNRNKRLYKSMKVAVAACEQHQQQWSQAIECTSTRAVQELFGRKPTSVPKWVLTKLNQRVSAIFLDTLPEGKSKIEEEPEAEPEVKAKVKAEVETPKKNSPRKSVTSEKSAKKKRKTRSDKGRKRGPRKGTKT
jgi:hypothetical protein